MNSRYLAALAWLMLPLTLPAAEVDCSRLDPAVVAQTFYATHADFDSEDPVKLKSLISARFYNALAQEYRCSRGEVCAIETDPWTGAQDGDIGKPVRFVTAKHSDTEATVSMTYPFILDKAHPQQKRATVVLSRQAKDACWQVSDLIDPDGDSLVQVIEKWHKEFGKGG